MASTPLICCCHQASMYHHISYFQPQNTVTKMHRFVLIVDCQHHQVCVATSFLFTIPRSTNYAKFCIITSSQYQRLEFACNVPPSNFAWERPLFPWIRDKYLCLVLLSEKSCVDEVFRSLDAVRVSQARGRDGYECLRMSLSRTSSLRFLSRLSS